MLIKLHNEETGLSLCANLLNTSEPEALRFGTLQATIVHLLITRCVLVAFELLAFYFLLEADSSFSADRFLVRLDYVTFA